MGDAVRRRWKPVIQSSYPRNDRWCEQVVHRGIGPDSICAGSDGALWFTEADGALGRLTVNGRFKEYSVAYRYNQPSGIAAGPDGALWFTDFSGFAGIGGPSAIGRIAMR